MSQTTLLYCSVLQAIATVLANVKAVTPKIRVIVHQGEIWNWNWYNQCNVTDFTQIAITELYTLKYTPQSTSIP